MNNLVLLDGNKISGGITYLTPECYSTEEREVGCWADGKPLYQKTFIWNPTSTETTIGVSSLNIDKLVKRQGTFTRNASGTIQQKDLEYRTEDASSNTYGIQCEIRSTNLFIHISAYTYSEITEVRITLQYTKTADTAGSGIWTPQGLPAVHYSTSEQVIGTWIDGSTLYQKTVELGAMPNATTKTVAHGISNVETIVSIDGYAKNTNNGVCVKLPHVYNDATFAKSLMIYADATNITLKDTENLSVYTEAYATLQYTKSS